MDQNNPEQEPESSRVDLSAVDDISLANYGAAVSKVEIDYEEKEIETSMDVASSEAPSSIQTSLYPSSMYQPSK